MDAFLSTAGVPELLAVVTSIVYSVALVSMRQGMRTGSPLAAVLVVNAFVAAWGLSAGFFRGTLQASAPAALLWFALAGCLGQGTGQLLFMVGMRRMGVSRSTPIQSSTPIWAVLFAVVFLGEAPGAAVWLGTAAIVTGVALLSVERAEDRPPFREWFSGALVFPLASSLLFATVPIFMKFGYAIQRTPLVGFGTAFAAGTLILFPGRLLLPAGGEIRADGRALRWFALAALCTATAATLFWTALTVGDVSVLLPLSRLVPLWVVIWSYFFLGGLERITARVAAAAGLVVAGGILITALR